MRSIKDLIKRNPSLYKYSVKIVNRLEEFIRSYRFHQNALESLELFSKCMDTHRYEYTLAFGSMLGAIREHGFIKHDLDIDTFMWADGFSPGILKSLTDVGFKWYASYQVKSGLLGREDTFEYKGVYIDIFWLYPTNNGLSYCCDFIKEVGMLEEERLPRRIILPVSRERKLVPFENIQLYVPNNADQICEYRYGPSYMIPDSNWHWETAKNSIEEWREMVSSTKCIHIHKPIVNH